MRVLLLTQVLPYPPDSGPKVKTHNVLKLLGSRCEVTLVSFVRGDESAGVEHLRRHCSSVHAVPMARPLIRDAWALGRSLSSRRPWTILRDDRQAMRSLVERVTAATSFEVVHVDQLNMAQYAARMTTPVRVLDAHNALWLLYRRMASTALPGVRRLLLEREWRLLRRYEAHVCREFDAVLAVSDEDKAALQSAAGASSDVTVVPIAIDTEEVVPLLRPPAVNRIVHMGTMYWPPNVDAVTWFARRVYPAVRAACPEAGFDVIGARPPREIRALEREFTDVRVVGYVGDPTPYLEHAAVFVVPLRAAAGMRVKILNALAQGLPVVSTTLGCSGIAAEPGRHLLLADTPEEFAAAVLRLLRDRVFADELGRNGRRLVQERYDYRRACPPLLDVYERCLRRRS